MLPVSPPPPIFPVFGYLRSFDHLARRMPEAVMVQWMTTVVTRIAGDPCGAHSVSPFLSVPVGVQAKAERHSGSLPQTLS